MPRGIAKILALYFRLVAFSDEVLLSVIDEMRHIFGFSATSCARVISIGNNSSEMERLQEMGLTVGTIFRVIKVAPFGDPVEIDLRGYRLCLRKNETKGFEVEPIE